MNFFKRSINNRSVRENKKNKEWFEEHFRTNFGKMRIRFCYLKNQRVIALRSFKVGLTHQIMPQQFRAEWKFKFEKMNTINLPCPKHCLFPEWNDNKSCRAKGFRVIFPPILYNKFAHPIRDHGFHIFGSHRKLFVVKTVTILVTGLKLLLKHELIH